MTQARKSSLGFTGAAALCAVLAGCGSNGTTGSAVTGLAVSQGPITGTVSLNDSSAHPKQRTVATRADGTFSFDVSELTPPYQLKVEWQDGAAAARLFAISDRNQSLDVNPLTHVAFEAAAGERGSDDAFDRSQPEEKRETARRAQGILSQLQTVLAPLFERYGITDPTVDRAAVRVLLSDVRIRSDDGVVTVINRETGGVIFTGPRDDLASGTFDAGSMPPGPDAPPAATCTSFTYASFGACQPDNTQTRSVLTSSPAGCTGGSPALSQPCTYVPPVNACTGFTYSSWAACQPDGRQARTILTSTPSGCTGGSPVVSQACTYVPPVTTCTSFTYAPWAACQPGNTQTRAVLTSSPSGCTGGSPVVSQACAYTPPACTYTYSAWGTCTTSGAQTRTVVSSAPAGCAGTPVLSQSCTPPTASCTGCHGIPPATGMHAFHQSRATCATCHGTGYSTTTANAATHQNGVKNLTTTIGWNATSRSCSNSCHGSKSW